MPINSFDDYPMTWKPNKEKLIRPYYKSLAHMLMEDILAGKLKPNTKLPPQRELADYLDLNLSTITKSYTHCERYGFLYGITGKGTFVSSNITIQDALFSNGHHHYELGFIEPFYEFDSLTLDIAKQVIQQDDAVKLLQYGEPWGSKLQLKMAQKYLSRLQLSVNIEQLAIFPGAQNAIAVTLMAFFNHGDKIAVDTYTYSNFRKLANTAGIQLIPIEHDEDGMMPTHLTYACNHHHIKGLFLMPTCSNPTNITTSYQRRKQLSKLIKDKNILLIEDETYAFISEPAIPPFASIIPANTIYINGLSKAVCAGLRIAYVSFPINYKVKLRETFMSVNLVNAALNIEIITRLITKGIVEQIIHKKREQSVMRNMVYQSIFPDTKDAQSFFRWLPLPSELSSEEFESYAKKHGIRILGSHHFLVGSTPKQNYIRIALSSIKSNHELRQALLLLKRLIDHEVKAPD